MALTDLTGTKWILTHGRAQATDFPNEQLITDIYNGEDSTEKIIRANYSNVFGGVLSFIAKAPVTWMTDVELWRYPSTPVKDYKTIIVEVLGGPASTVPATIAWFEANATQIVDPPEGKKFIDLTAGLATIRDWIKSKLAKKAELSVASISTAGGGDEVHATISQETDAVNINYYKDGTALPDYVNLQIDGDTFSIPTDASVDDRLATKADADAVPEVTARIGTLGKTEAVTIKPTPDAVNYVTLTNSEESFTGRGVVATFAGENGSIQKMLPPKDYVDDKTGDLSTLVTGDKSNLVGAINEVYEKSGEPFRVKEWGATALSVNIPTCTTDIDNINIDKLVYKITGQEAIDYQIVGMLAYQLTDANGARINCWPVCQFTGQGQTELNVRMMCAGTTNKTATKINAWVLLRHR